MVCFEGDDEPNNQSSCKKQQKKGHPKKSNGTAKSKTKVSASTKVTKSATNKSSIEKSITQNQDPIATQNEHVMQASSGPKEVANDLVLMSLSVTLLTRLPR